MAWATRRRVKGQRIVCKDTTFTSKAQGTRESKKVEIQGRVPFDMFEVRTGRREVARDGASDGGMGGTAG